MSQQQKKVSDAKGGMIVSSVAQHLPAPFLHCRDLRHTWTITAPFEKAGFTLTDKHGEHAAYVRELQCAVCETVRVDTYTLRQKSGHAARMERWSVSYRYPDGYHMDLREVPRSVKVNQILRYELLRRVLAETKAP